MIARLLEESDIPILNRIAQQNGYEYPDLSKPDIEAAMVVEDASGKIIAAAAAKRISELYLWVGETSPIQKMAALRALHEAMAMELRELEYHESNIFLPPKLEKAFGRRLSKSFGWQWNWRSLFLKF